MLLLKAAILMFKQLRKWTSLKVKSLAVATLIMVCRQWWKTLTGRPFIKQQIKKTFNR
jgi:hypothetical protein